MIDRIKADATALAAAQGGRWQECANRLNVIAQPVRLPESVARKTWVGLQALFGLEQAAIWKASILEAIDASNEQGDVLTVAMLSLMDQSLGGVGYDFGDPQVQRQLDVLESMGLLSQGDVEKLKGIGVYLEQVTAVQVSFEWQSELDRQAYEVINQARSDWDALSANIRSQIENGQLVRSQVIAAVSQLWS